MVSKLFQGWIQKGNGPFHPEETYKSLITISVELLKALALINGGAAVAILAYLGRTRQSFYCLP